MILELLAEMATKHTPWPLSYIPGVFLAGLRKGLTGPAKESQLKFLEAELGDKDWFSGRENPGRADFMLSWPLDTLAHRKWVDFEGGYPKLGAWRGRVMGRDAWKRGLGKGNGYDLTF